jgi:hypothetical protein
MGSLGLCQIIRTPHARQTGGRRLFEIFEKSVGCVFFWMAGRFVALLCLLRRAAGVAFRSSSVAYADECTVFLSGKLVYDHSQTASKQGTDVSSGPYRLPSLLLNSASRCSDMR